MHAGRRPKRAQPLAQAQGLGADLAGKQVVLTQQEIVMVVIEDPACRNR